MKKLIRGVVEFREKIRPHMLGHFEKLALGQTPDALLITCSDSRVAVNVFASTDPGDLFVLRNIGNIIPPYGPNKPESFVSGAAVDFALDVFKLKHIIVCGHSECGAMITIHKGLDKVSSPSLKGWLQYGIENLKTADHNTLSQHNVLRQVENLKTYPEVQKLLKENKLQIHGWWFEIKSADVFAYSFTKKEFLLIDENSVEFIFGELSKKN